MHLGVRVPFDRASVLRVRVHLEVGSVHLGTGAIIGRGT